MITLNKDYSETITSLEDVKKHYLDSTGHCLF